MNALKKNVISEKWLHENINLKFSFHFHGIYFLNDVKFYVKKYIIFLRGMFYNY